MTIIAIKMHIHVCINSQQKNLVYAFWQEVPKLMYAFLMCQPVVRTSPEQNSMVKPIQMHYAVSNVALQQGAHL